MVNAAQRDADALALAAARLAGSRLAYDFAYPVSYMPAMVPDGRVWQWNLQWMGHRKLSGAEARGHCCGRTQ